MREPLHSPLGYSYYILDEDFIAQHKLKTDSVFTPDEIKLLDIFVVPENGQSYKGYKIIEVDHFVLSARRLLMAAVVEDSAGKDQYLAEDLYRINPEQQLTGMGSVGLQVKRDGLMKYLEGIAVHKPQPIIDPKTFDTVHPGTPEYNAYVEGIVRQIETLNRLIEEMDRFG
jgi:hypothetical protein